MHAEAVYDRHMMSTRISHEESQLQGRGEAKGLTDVDCSNLMKLLGMKAGTAASAESHSKPGRGWRSGLDLNHRDPSIQPSGILVPIPLAMNWPHFLVANAHVGMPFDVEAGVSSEP
jgi:hypothetical protein